MHTPHEDIHDVGLVDGCRACEEHAEHPTRNLDSTMLRELVARTLDNRFRDPANVGARSDTEAFAMRNVMNILEWAGKLAEVAPDDVAWYLTERWKVDLAGDSATREIERRFAADGPH